MNVGEHSIEILKYSWRKDNAE